MPLTKDKYFELMIRIRIIRTSGVPLVLIFPAPYTNILVFLMTPMRPGSDLNN